MIETINWIGGLIYLVLLWLNGFFIGVVALFAYMVGRMMKNPGWDDSNMTNAVRLLAHVVMHPGDFLQMFYLTPEQRDILGHSGIDPRDMQRPFWYVDKDELSEVVKTRPPSNSVTEDSVTEPLNHEE